MVLRVSLLCLILGSAAAAAADDTPPAKSSAREALRARIAEDAKKTAPKPTPKADATAAPVTATPAADSKTSPAAPAATTPSTKTASTPVAKEKPTVLPKVEVRKDRVREIDLQIAQQERDIERERKNTKSSEVDVALNDEKIARPLAIFGGDSSQFRKGVASERVFLMEAEKDILEAISHAKTKDEKAALQKQLDELRAMRRQLDKSMR